MKKLFLLALLCLPFSVSASVPPALYGPQLDHEDGYEMKMNGYIRIIDSCREHFEGVCLNVRSGPSTSTLVLRKIRNNFVREIDKMVWNEGRWWYRITHENETIRFPERLGAKYWYVAAEFTEWIPPYTEAVEYDSDKRIVIDRTHQTLTAYEGDTVVYTMDVSTGIAKNPTPAGSFTVFKKMPTRYMQGPLDSLGILDSWDLPGAAYTMYFTYSGAAIHVAPWHRSFGKPYSHGCVNTRYRDGKWLYDWTATGTPVIVKG